MIPEILGEKDHKKRRKLVNKWWKHTREVREKRVCPECGNDKFITTGGVLEDGVPYWETVCSKCGFLMDED